MAEALKEFLETVDEDRDGWSDINSFDSKVICSCCGRFIDDVISTLEPTATTLNQFAALKFDDIEWPDGHTGAKKVFVRMALKKVRAMAEGGRFCPTLVWECVGKCDFAR